jgi:CheY-like chemotaxis protein
MRRERVVIVDDDPEAVEALAAVLEDPRYEIEGHTDPARALATIEAARPLLVVTDLGMPKMSGRDLIKAIRARWGDGDPAVMVLSGEGDEDIMLECFSLGAADYLTKPIAVAELRAKAALLASRVEAARLEARDTAPGEHGTRLVIDAHALQPGDRCGGYTIVGRLGAGGMGVVYKAASERYGTVALKVLTPELSKDRALLARFFREAQHLKAVRHPNIVSFYDLGHHGGAYFLVMEYAPGEPLDVRYRDALPLTEREALRIAGEIARALEALHGASLVHRDLKPANVMVDDAGGVKLVDFGLAKRAFDDQLTDSDVLMGTPHYLAPERITGNDALDIRSDLYALGVLLFFLLTGRPPFVGDTPFAVLQGHASEPAPSVRTLNPATSPETEALLATLLAKSPEDRPQSPAAVLATLALRTT